MHKEDERRLVIAYGERHRIRTKKDELVALIQKLNEVLADLDTKSCLTDYRDVADYILKTKERIFSDMETLKREIVTLNEEIRSLERKRNGE